MRNEILAEFRAYAAGWSSNAENRGRLIAFVFGEDVGASYSRKLAGSAADFYALLGEAAAVPAYDELRGRVPEMYVSLKPGFDAASGVDEQVRQAISQIIGPIARPAHVWVASDLPKTRSGKIMRRVIASISNFIDVGDTTTLSNPEIVEEIQQQVQSAKVAAGQVPKGVPQTVIDEIKQFGEER